VSIIRRILGETRAIGGNQWLSDLPTSSTAGVQINETNATSIGAVYAAVKLYADTVASLPVDTYIRRDGTRRPIRPRPSWIDQPIPNNPNYTGFEFRHRIVSSLLLDGNAFILFLTGRNGDIVETRVLDPKKVTIKVGANGAPVYVVSNGKDGMEVGPEAMVHIPLFATGENLRGMSPVEHHRVTLGLASATQLYSAKFYEQGAAPSAVIKIPGELTQDQADSLRQSFSRKHEGVDRMHKIAVLTGGADFQQMSMKLVDMQLVETMHWGVESIARIYGVPLHLLQYPGGNSSYSSIEVISIEWLRLGLGPLIARIEAGLQQLVPGAEQTFLKFTIDGLLRPTTKERYDAYAVALQNGILSLNEVRRLEDRPDLPMDGDQFWKPLNIGVVGEQPKP